MVSAAGGRRRFILVAVVAIVWLTAIGCSLEPTAIGGHAERQTTHSEVESRSDVQATGRQMPVPSDAPSISSSPPTVVLSTSDPPSSAASSASELPPALLPTTVPRRQIPPTTAPLAGCAAAVDYLSKHAAPGFRFVCPGDALGHQAMTCVNTPGTCPNQQVIVIADPSCAPAIRNEALNSWIMTGQLKATVDADGHC